MPLDTPPAARWNRETGSFDRLDEGGAAEPAPAYTDGQMTVKGVVVNVLVPQAMAARAELAQVPIATNVKVGALTRLKAAIDRAEAGGTTPPPPVRSPDAALARSCLGREIQDRRKKLGLSRKALHATLGPLIDAFAGEHRLRGWGGSSVQAWERGEVTPRQIDPIITALKVTDPAVVERWRRWWATSRVGIPEEQRQAILAEAPALLVPEEDLDALEAALDWKEAQIRQREAELAAAVEEDD